MDDRGGLLLSPMPGWLALTLLGIGTALNIFGLFCAGTAFKASWDEYGEGDLWPWLGAAITRTKQVASRLAFWRRQVPQTVEVSGAGMVASGGYGRATVRMGFPQDASDAERIAQLERAVQGIYDDLAEDRGVASRHDAEFTQRLEEVDNKIESESQRLEDLSRAAASSDIQLQLVGLMAIGVGTVLTAVPGIWQVLVSLTGGS
jgi:hypothetical protein